MSYYILLTLIAVDTVFRKQTQLNGGRQQTCTKCEKVNQP